MSDTSSSLLVVRVGPGNVPSSEVENRMKKVVQGDLVPLDTLADITDWAAIKKAGVCIESEFRSCSCILVVQYYKLNGEPAVKALEKNSVRQNTIVDELVTSFVAMKSVMS